MLLVLSGSVQAQDNAIYFPKFEKGGLPNEKTQNRDATTIYPVNDPFFGFQREWARQIGLLDLWDERGVSVSMQSGNTPVIAIDSGVDAGHPDYKGRVVCEESKDFIQLNKDPCVDNTHGTGALSAGFANGNDSRGMAGINWSSKIRSYKIMDSEPGQYGELVLRTSLPAITDAFRNLAELPDGLAVATASFIVRERSPSLIAAIKALEKKVFIVTVADKVPSADTAWGSPCGDGELPHVLCVTAHQNGRFWLGSSSGFVIRGAAPGVGLVAAFPGEQWGTFTGTSIAGPQFAAAAALVADYAADRGLKLTPAQLKIVMIRGMKFEYSLVSALSFYKIGTPATLYLPKLFREVDRMIESITIVPLSEDHSFVEAPETVKGAGNEQTLLVGRTVELSGKNLTSRRRMFLNQLELPTVCISPEKLSVFLSPDLPSLLWDPYNVLYSFEVDGDGEPDPFSYREHLSMFFVKR